MLKVSNLTKVFAKDTVNERVAINNLSLHVPQGQFVGIIGENGAGKSTLLNLISGFYTTDSGQILLADKDITKQKEYKRSRRIGRVFQDPLKGTAFDMTIEENLALAISKNKPLGLSQGVSKKDENYFKEELSQLDLGLENRLKHKVGLLSGGQRQALTLLMAILSKPDLLLLDEHTAALDPGSAENIINLTNRIVKDANLTTLMVTHNMKQALNMGSRTIMMSDGDIVFDVSGEERAKLGVSDLIRLFAEKKGKELDSDKMLLG
jgi:ABC-type uncharacterized transport system, ATPase component